MSREIYPDDLTAEEQWITWTVIERNGKPTKVPRAPYTVHGSRRYDCDSQDPDNWTDFETAKSYAEELPDFYIGYVIPGEEHDDDVVLIDFDNVRDPDTGDLHPKAQELLERTDTYGQVSASGTGIHLYPRGELPDGVKSIDADLPATDQFPDPEIEVYDKSRFMGVTGKHIESTPTVCNDEQEVIDELAENYVTVPESKQQELTTEPLLDKPTVSDIEKTDEIRDVFDAIQHVAPRDIRIRSPVTEKRSNGVSRDPSWAHSESGTRLWQYPDNSKGPWFNYRKGHYGLDCLHLVALEEGIVRDEGDYPTGDDFWEAVAALRDRGADIPEYVPSLYHHNQAVVLPELTADGSDGSDAPSKSELYTRNENIIRRAIENRDDILLNALMSTGKTHSFGKVVAEEGYKAAYFTGRQEGYTDMESIAEQYGIPPEEIKILPSMPRDCPTYRGDHGDEWANRVRTQYRNGADPKAIHEGNDDIPCRHGDTKCPYEQKWSIDFDDYQLLIGHYKHSYLTPVTAGRSCAFDERVANSFTIRIDHSQLVSSVNTFCEDYDIPIEGWTDLRDNRHNPDLKREVARWFDAYEGDGWNFSPDSKGVIAHQRRDGRDYHAYTAHAIYGIVSATPVEEGSEYERGAIPETKYDALYATEYVEIKHQPDLSYTQNVMAFDGTPLMTDTDFGDREQAPREWEDALGKHLTVKRLMSDEERAAYLSHTLDLTFVQTSEHTNPYSSARYNDPAADAALCAAVTEWFGNGEPPVVFAPKKVVTGADDGNPETETIGYENRGFIEEGIVKDFDWPGNLRGSNEYATERLGVILGSTHHGDGEIGRRSAWHHSGIDPSGKGNDRDYGTEMGNAVYDQMTRQQTLQSALRFGRDGGGATIVLHTSLVPDIVPVHERASVSTWKPSMRDVQAAFEATGEDTMTAEAIATHDAVDVTVRTVRSALTDLAELGFVERRKDPDDRRRTLWDDTGVSDLDECEMAEFEVEDVDTSTVDVDESMVVEEGENLRIKVLTWDFSNSASESSEKGGPLSDADAEAQSGGGGSNNWGDLPPG